MDLLGTIHLATAVLAIVSGAAVLLTGPKGARRHRQLGWVYVGAMLTLNGTAFMIYKLFGGFGPFHYAALFSLVTVSAGTLSAVAARRHRRARNARSRALNVERHYMWMTFSYAGLIAAFASETITRLPALRPVFGGGKWFGLAVAAATIVVMVVGTRMIKGRKADILASVAPRR